LLQNIFGIESIQIDQIIITASPGGSELTTVDLPIGGMVTAYAGREEMWAEWQDTYRRYEVIVKELLEAEKTFKDLEEKK